MSASYTGVPSQQQQGAADALLLLQVPSLQTTVEYHYEGTTQLLAKGQLQVMQTTAETAYVDHYFNQASGSTAPAPPYSASAQPGGAPAPGGPDNNYVIIAFLTVGDTYTRPLLPVTQVVKIGERSFMFPADADQQHPTASGGGGPQGFHKLELGADVSPLQIEEFENALAFTALYARSEFRSSLAFVNPSGQVIGTLADSVKFVEDKNVAEVDNSDALSAKAPVVIDVDEKASISEGREVRRVHRADNLTDSIANYSEIISEYIVKGAALVSEGILAGSQKLTAHVSPNEKPLTFQPQTKERVLRAKQLTGTAVKVTAKVVENAVKLAMMLGNGVLNTAVPASKDKAGQKKQGPVKRLTSSLAYAVGNVADGVDRGARLLWNASSSSTATLVGHRYGAEAGNLTANALSIAENLTLVYFDSKGVSRRVIVRKAAAKIIKDRASGGGKQK